MTTPEVTDVKAALTAGLTELRLPTVRHCYEETARLAERGKFDGIFLADIVGVYDVYRGGPAPVRAADRAGARFPQALQRPLPDLSVASRGSHVRTRLC